MGLEFRHLLQYGSLFGRVHDAFSPNEAFIDVLHGLHRLFPLFGLCSFNSGMGICGFVGISFDYVLEHRSYNNGRVGLGPLVVHPDINRSIQGDMNLTCAPGELVSDMKNHSCTRRCVGKPWLNVRILQKQTPSLNRNNVPDLVGYHLRHRHI